MSRTLVGLVSRCWAAELLPVLSAGFLVLLCPVSPILRIPLLLALALPIFALGVLVGRFTGEWPTSVWLWRFSRRVAAYRTLSAERAAVHYPAKLEAKIGLLEVLQIAQSERDKLAERFGFPLRRCLHLVIYPGHAELSADFGQSMGGTALVVGNAVLLAVDCSFEEGLRHELVHLFAARWNPYAPPILQEGLAIWLQGTLWGEEFGAVIGRLLRAEAPELEALLDRRVFFSEGREHGCYALAGAFTGFLVRRFGWERYRGLYRKADQRNLRSRFVKYFGMSLDEAWRQWSDEARRSIQEVPTSAAISGRFVTGPSEN